mmetsp:Transcript_53156/g.137351  ORF Transcript_53156/g.137351 Transcript_53156/m.137351 type:complete len:108 (-) Transcript_53156:20-343(-)
MWTTCEKICVAVVEIATLPGWLLLLTIVATSIWQPAPALVVAPQAHPYAGHADLWFAPLNRSSALLQVSEHALLHSLAGADIAAPLRDEIVLPDAAPGPMRHWGAGA